MKKVNLNGKLVLGKETVSKLNNEEMTAIVGGSTTTFWSGNSQAVCGVTCFVSQGTTACCA